MQDREVENKIDEILESIKNCSVVISQNDFYQTYHSACALSVDVKGLWMEFGVYRGTSISNFAKFCPTTIYGFDSFEGLPETWDDDNKKGRRSFLPNEEAEAVATGKHREFEEQFKDSRKKSKDGSPPKENRSPLIIYI